MTCYISSLYGKFIFNYPQLYSIPVFAQIDSMLFFAEIVRLFVYIFLSTKFKSNVCYSSKLLRFNMSIRFLKVFFKKLGNLLLGNSFQQ